MDVRQRAHAVTLVAPATSVLSGRSAAWLHGADILRPADPVEITLERDTSMRPRAGLTLRRALLPDEDVESVHGIRVTNPLRTCFDLARRPDVVEAVVAVDALTHARLVKPEEILTYAPEHRGWRGVRQIPKIMELSEPLAESPMETRIRLVVVFAGLPRPEPQIAVYDQFGMHQGRIDMGYRDARTGIEYDGQHHRDQWESDIRRQNALRATGWTLLRYSAYDVYQQPHLIVHQVAEAIRRA